MPSTQSTRKVYAAIDAAIRACNNDKDEQEAETHELANRAFQLALNAGYNIDKFETMKEGQANMLAMLREEITTFNITSRYAI